MYAVKFFTTSYVHRGCTLLILTVERIVNPDEAGDHYQTDEDIELPSFSLATISIATSNFSSTNILGQGGFGIVYKVY